ncbi:Twin-arginine translocation protein TatB [Brachybacterium faecium]|uniref:Sec-independent protein secretion pathway component n=1 Tax=Brachybacterium faecium (strain ATCC 43885 / DSM 4810 / JCM 11609 / LMG 19847 / NBRC 14762 / NCIMB 9860 / 6-10) TaxID=446465 RepID=C7MBL5_BRAFD|nr:twin-arginine translocase TatA/TatE family subunit [Brachybacterium faecium]ACU84972.1 Sec-independent protein secretion pathway component [Brachybacterium faecium DSM 4810]SLM98500.1 Twin-arginine translocation protein TatB [Brachybacterium faecium]HJG52204.1 twin-arginine translocase TatA/TatE family subunit [Brachybacterium faecium]
MGGTGFMGLGGWELVVLLIVFLVIVGPQRLPEVTRQLVQWVRQARRWVEDSRSTVEDEMGIAIEDLRKYDPRQYDPRRIIREAWGDTDIDELLPSKDAMNVAAGGAAGAAASSSRRSSRSKKDEGPQRAPFDDEAT